MKKELLNFTKYVRRQEICRFLVQYELFKKIQGVKGSIIECGVYLGSGLMAWAKLAETFEPYNFLQKIIGFDTFEGFPSISSKDVLQGAGANIENQKAVHVSHLKENWDIYAELQECIDNFNATRLLKHQEKVLLVKGNALATIPQYLSDHPYLLVSLLYLDFDLYEPTKLALKEFLPRMPKGGIIAFDELHDPKFPGETRALLESLNLNYYKLESFSFEPHISWIQL